MRCERWPTALTVLLGACGVTVVSITIFVNCSNRFRAANLGPD
jgi:hypothetical protein